MHHGNLFAGLPAVATGEVFEPLLQQGNVLIERIVSSAAPMPADYDQERDEWVCLLQGQATLLIDGEEIQMAAGDWRLIPAHCPHRVLAMSAAPTCLWLAVHVYPAAGVASVVTDAGQ